MHPRTKAKTLEVTKTMLDLIATGLMTWAVFGSPRSIGKYERILRNFGEYNYHRIKTTMKRLRMQNMIQYDENDLKSPILLTEKGMIRLARFKFRDLFKYFKRKKWDHFWRIVFFDIPEDDRHIRNKLRQELIAAGFYPFQRSVFVCPFDCEEAIRDLCKMYGISRNVLFCVTPSLGEKENEVRNFFFTRGIQRRRSTVGGD